MREFILEGDLSCVQIVLRSREGLHTGEEQFMCAECGKAYSTEKNLSRHRCKRIEVFEIEE